MKSNFIRHWIIGIAFILITSITKASELKSDELNYKITVPDGWKVDFQNSAGFSIDSPESPPTKTITLIISRNVDFETINSNSIASIKNEFLKTGSREVSSTNFSVDEIPACKIVGWVGKSPFASSFIFQAMLADKKLYCLQASHFRGDISRDSDVQEAIASFHFLRSAKLLNSSSFKFGSLGLKFAVPAVGITGLLFWLFLKRNA